MKRLRYAAAAFVCAVVFLVVVPHAQADDCSPLCAIYTSVWDPLYWFHGCYQCPPPPAEG